MSLDTYMRQALRHSADAVRKGDGVRPTFIVASAEGTYTLALGGDGALQPDDLAMQILSAVLRWSMARAFIVTCEHRDPSRLAAYIVSGRGVRGLSIAVRKNPLNLGVPKLATPPGFIKDLRALIPPRVSELSQAEVANLEEVLGVELEECQSLYVN